MSSVSWLRIMIFESPPSFHRFLFRAITLWPKFCLGATLSGYDSYFLYVISQPVTWSPEIIRGLHQGAFGGAGKENHATESRLFSAKREKEEGYIFSPTSFPVFLLLFLYVRVVRFLREWNVLVLHSIKKSRWQLGNVVLK